MPDCRIQIRINRSIENKGEFCDLVQTSRIENCAIRDAVAQLKMKWRKLDGAKKSFFQLCYV
jgi:hypothetical protein